jgi:hypothetical protein
VRRLAARRAEVDQPDEPLAVGQADRLAPGVVRRTRGVRQ